MERLTYRDENGKAWAKLKTSASSDETMKYGRLSLDRLAAYEDTGLTPEQTASLESENEKLKTAITDPSDMDAFVMGYPVKELIIFSTEMMKNHISPSDICDAAKMYAKGYSDCKNEVDKAFERALNSNLVNPDIVINAENKVERLDE